MSRPAADVALIQIVDKALEDANVRSGDWLACRPGCSPCCTGIFPINALDAERLRDGFLAAEIGLQGRIRERVQSALKELQPEWPGDFETGEIDCDAEGFEEFGNDLVCPVLNPEIRTCDLYAARPMTCRAFGPPVPNGEGGIGICELCFVGAPVEAIEAAAMDVSFYAKEEEINAALPERTTVIAMALRAL